MNLILHAKTRARWLVEETLTPIRECGRSGNPRFFVLLLPWVSALKITAQQPLTKPPENRALATPGLSRKW